jgi:hypothetical protein
MPNKHFSTTAPRARKVRARPQQEFSATAAVLNANDQSLASQSPRFGDPVLLVDNRFFRPGGIRVGTMQNMMFRPGLAPDHNSPPPAFRRTSRLTTIPYSKGRKYVKSRGISKLAASSKYKKGKQVQEDTQHKLIAMLGGDPDRVARQMKASKRTAVSPKKKHRHEGEGEGGRATKLINGKETRARQQGKRPKSRLNFDRLAIEISAGTIMGPHSICSVPKSQLKSSYHL